MANKQKDAQHVRSTRKYHQEGTALEEGRATRAALHDFDPELDAFVQEHNEAVVKLYERLEEKLLGAKMPVAKVKLIHVSRIRANDYNPNSVAGQEMKLLHTSISSDGYTQPVVAIEDENSPGYYEIVDGFHRYTTMRRYQDVADGSLSYLPVVVLEKSIADRIASTVRHNRARGKHSVQGMGSLVFQMLEAGEEDVTICNKLGLEPEELARLKHITGFSKLFNDVEYSTLVQTKTQMRERAEYAKAHPEETPLPEGV